MHEKLSRNIAPYLFFFHGGLAGQPTFRLGRHWEFAFFWIPCHRNRFIDFLHFFQPFIELVRLSSVCINKNNHKFCKIKWKPKQISKKFKPTFAIWRSYQHTLHSEDFSVNVPFRQLLHHCCIVYLTNANIGVKTFDLKKIYIYMYFIERGLIWESYTFDGKF